MVTTFKDITNVLKKGAGAFRGSVDSANFKDYVLTMLVIKFISDRYKESAKSSNLKDHQTFDWLYMQRTSPQIGTYINNALKGIEEANPTELKGVFTNIDYDNELVLGNEQQKNSRLRTLLEEFNTLDLRPSQLEQKSEKRRADIIGDAYEFMIGEYAKHAGRKSGSFFTPSSVSELMVRLINPQNNETIYDPTCGVASLLLRAAKHVGVNHGSIYGQESNRSTWAMAKINLYLHSVSNTNIAWGNTLCDPMHIDGAKLKKFDIILANMPFSVYKWSDGFRTFDNESQKNKSSQFKMISEMDKYHRFDWGVPPLNNGDWAFLLHMINSMNDLGRIAAVVPHGVLFREAQEGKIRRKVIEENLIDAVIGLPPNMFYGTFISACIIIFKNHRKKSDIVFIDASSKDFEGQLRYEKGKSQNTLNAKNVDDIVSAYLNRCDINGFVHKAELSEIKNNNYLLDIQRYVVADHKEYIPDIDELEDGISEIKDEIEKAEKELQILMKRLGVI